MAVNNVHTVRDFTEERYRVLLGKAAARFRICRIGHEEDASSVALWRHDIDYSPQRALGLARIEAEMGVTSTYYVLLGSPFYNPFEAAVSDTLREIVHLGHDIGLHYDAQVLGSATADHVEQIGFEANTLSRHLGASIRSFSLHNPSVSPDVQLNEPHYAGLLNASAPSLRERYTYVSDSNGRWWYRSLDDVLNDPASLRIYALTHPEWWTAQPMPPSGRVQRCIDGRAKRVAADYRAFLTKHRPEALSDE